MARGTCPHCKRNFARIDMHTVCVLEPTVIAWLTQNLPDPDAPRYILPVYKFDMLNPPVSRRPLEDYYGTWRGVAAAFGLLMHRRARGEAVGQLDADVTAELRRLADELHGGDFGPSSSEYDTFRSPGAIMRHGLQHRHGAWADVLAMAGLRVGTMSEYQLASIARRRANQANQNERGRGSFERGDEPISREYVGLSVLPNPRPLASGGVAWMVR